MEVEFAFVVLKLLVFIVCGVIGILKTDFFNFLKVQKGLKELICRKSTKL